MNVLWVCEKNMCLSGCNIWQVSVSSTLLCLNCFISLFIFCLLDLCYIESAVKSHYYCFRVCLIISPIAISGCCVIWCLYRKSLLNLDLVDWSRALGNGSNSVLACWKFFLLVYILFPWVSRKYSCIAVLLYVAF